jgi:hypothetical protein
VHALGFEDAIKVSTPALMATGQTDLKGDQPAGLLWFQMLLLFIYGGTMVF